MKVTVNWLKQYVDFDWSPELLGEKLTMLGMEVEGIDKISGEFDGVVVAQVLEAQKHPNADKLSVCRVADGQGERQIVCGAKNFKAGDKVPLVLPGATLPTKPGEPPFVIKVGKIRGVESFGMMCSPKELGLAEDSDGLMILPADARVGQPFAEFLGRSGSDAVLDLEITPNRPDLNSIIGIAREIAALTGKPLRIPDPTLPTDTNPDLTVPPIDSLVGVRIENEDLCPRYTARIVLGVKVGPSPDWLRQNLEKVGLRSINNVVDVTNFVMLESGQPLHAFDYHLLHRVDETRVPVVVIRQATDGEPFTTLDGTQRTLSGSTLVIADEARAIALAGVMGGQNSEINSTTTDVLIESACFQPQSIRATSKRLALRTDASYRFERGSDVGVCDWASRRCAELILKTAGGALVRGVVDAWPHPKPLKEIALRAGRANELLGMEISLADQHGYLQRLGILPTTIPITAAEPSTESAQRFTIPTFRVDLKREVDLIEEIARLHGVDRIPTTTPRGAVGSHPYDAVHDQLAEARRILVGLGLNEAQGQTLVSEVAAKLAAQQLVALDNPLSSDMNVLRPSLLPGLLDSLRSNLNRRVEDVALFELGRVFVPGSENNNNANNNAGGGIAEQRRLAIALTGKRQGTFWSGSDRDARFDIYDLKGLLDEFLEQFGLKGVSLARREGTTSLFLESAVVQLGRLPLGECGQVLPPVAKQYDLRDGVFMAELDLDQLLSRRNVGKAFKQLPAFPSIRRDVAFLAPEKVAHEQVLTAVRQAKAPALESVELFDIFRGQNVPEGQKSMAYAFIYRGTDRTLTDTEVNDAHEKLVGKLKQVLGLSVRE